MKTANIIFKILGYGIILGGLSILTLYAMYPTENYQNEYREYFNSVEENKGNTDTYEAEEQAQHKVAEVKTVKYESDSKPLEQEKSEIQNSKNKATKPDNIIGVWEVNNDHYMAMYEVEKHQGKYIGKIHYYNDGKSEYTGKNTKGDYFLDGVIYENGVYKNGKMYMPNGTHYQVIFRLKNNNELEANMNVEGSPYTEIWKRQNAK